MLRKLVVAVLALERDRPIDEKDGCGPAGAAEIPLEILVGLDVEADVEGRWHEEEVLGVVAERAEDVVGLEELGLDELLEGLLGEPVACPVPLTVRGTQALVSFAPLAFKLFYAARQNAVLRRSSFPPP